MFSIRRTFALTCLLIGAAACSSAEPGGTTTKAAADTAAGGGDTPDLQGETASADATVVETSDTYVVDVEQPDVEQPDVEQPDVGPPDVPGPDVQEPDLQEPDLQEPDLQAPDLIVDIEQPDVPDDVEQPDVDDIQFPDIPTCILGQNACTCNAGACDAGLVCDPLSLLCRLPMTCQTLQCKPNQTCTPKADADASCNAECDANFNYLPLADACTPCVSAGCLAEPCNGGDPAFKDCLDSKHGCVTVAGVVSCGACLTGYKLDSATGTCIAIATCGGAICAVTQYCDFASGPAPTCVPRPCPNGQAATSHDAAPTCQACTLDCSGPGLTGQIWPYTDKGKKCICETDAGHFLVYPLTNVGTLCDADSDGWVRSDAAQILSGCDAGAPVGICDIDRKANARCNVSAIDGVLLQDEYGIAKEFVWCDGVSVQAKSGCSGAATPMRLIETQLNDEPRAKTDSKSPSYGATGRQLRPEELTFLTKACIDVSADYNGDYQSDISETQQTLPDAGSQVWTAEQKALHQFAYFVELYVASYYPTAGSPGLGKLVIRERSRCELDFPLRYDPTVTLTDKGGAQFPPYGAKPTDNPYAATGTIKPAPNGAGKDYWRNCQRRRDPAFDGNLAPVPTFDFARFDCTDLKGACPVLAPAHPTIDATPGLFDPTQTILRGHGLCNLGTDAKGLPQTPKDGVWRGMTHHSQFKCVQVNAAQDFATPVPDVLTSWTDAAPWILNDCRALPCAPGSAACQKSAPGTLGMQSPVVQCTAKAPGKPVSGQVGWAVRNFKPYGTSTAVGPVIPPAVLANMSPATLGSYPGGCMDEDVEWVFADKDPSKPNLAQSNLCPYPTYLSSIVSTGTWAPTSFNTINKQWTLMAEAFGRYSCFGQNQNFLWAGTDAKNPWAVPAWATLCLDGPCYLDYASKLLLPSSVEGLWR